MATIEKTAETTGPSVADEVAELIARSRAAQQQIENATQEQVDTWIRGMVYAVAKPGMDEEIARETVEETQLGNYEGKFKKISVKTRAALMDIIDDKSVGDVGKKIHRQLSNLSSSLAQVGDRNREVYRSIGRDTVTAWRALLGSVTAGAPLMGSAISGVAGAG